MRFGKLNKLPQTTHRPEDELMAAVFRVSFHRFLAPGVSGKRAGCRRQIIGLFQTQQVVRRYPSRRGFRREGAGRGGSLSKVDRRRVS